MTLPRRRGSRPRGRARLALTGDYPDIPDSSEAATDVLASYDGTAAITVTVSGAAPLAELRGPARYQPPAVTS